MQHHLQLITVVVLWLGTQFTIENTLLSMEKCESLSFKHPSVHELYYMFCISKKCVKIQLPVQLLFFTEESRLHSSMHEKAVMTNKPLEVTLSPEDTLWIDSLQAI